MGETAGHKLLKLLAAQWAKEQGYRTIGYEISLPHCGCRADVAAYRWASELKTVVFEGKKLRQSQAVIGSTAVFECKQARGDLFKDSCQTVKTQQELQKMQASRATLERLLKVHHPTAGLADSLFQEYESFDFSALGHQGYNRLIQRIAALQNALLGKTKFETLVRYRCANLFYLVTPPHILKNYELPHGWGHLVKKGEGLELVQKPQWLESSEGSRLGILQRLAK